MYRPVPFDRDLNDRVSPLAFEAASAGMSLTQIVGLAAGRL